MLPVTVFKLFNIFDYILIIHNHCLLHLHDWTFQDKKTKNKTEIPDDVLKEVMKKPRTRAVSLTLSENGIDEDMTQVGRGLF